MLVVVRFDHHGIALGFKRSLVQGGIDKTCPENGDIHGLAITGARLESLNTFMIR